MMNQHKKCLKDVMSIFLIGLISMHIYARLVQLINKLKISV